MNDSLTRRGFLQYASATMLSTSTPRCFGARAAPLRIGYVEANDARAASRLAGLQLGLDEAKRGVALFGGGVDLVALKQGIFQPAGLSAVIGDADADRTAALAERAEAARVLFINVACSADDLRGARCRRTLFHVAPSARMAHDAAAQAKDVAGARIVAWDPSLERFGADTLNQRFRSRFDTDMTSDAWLAWLAMKILWESSLRAKSVDPVRLLAYLDQPTTQFDGHKGRPLSFRAWDHQLRQPLYVASAAGVTEVPSSAGDESSRDALDRLGTTAAQSSCHLGS